MSTYFRLLPCLAALFIITNLQLNFVSGTAFESQNRFCMENNTCAMQVTKDHDRAHPLCMRGACEKIRCGHSAISCNSDDYRALLVENLNKLRVVTAKRLRITNMNYMVYDYDLEYMAFCLSSLCSENKRTLKVVSCLKINEKEVIDVVLREFLFDVEEGNFHYEYRNKMMLETMYHGIYLLRAHYMRWFGCARRTFQYNEVTKTRHITLVCVVRNDTTTPPKVVEKGQVTDCTPSCEDSIDTKINKRCGNKTKGLGYLCGENLEMPDKKTAAATAQLLQDHDQKVYDLSGENCPDTGDWVTNRRRRRDASKYRDDYYYDSYEYDLEYDEDADEDHPRSRPDGELRTRTMFTCPTAVPTPFVPRISEETKRYLDTMMEALDRMLIIVNEAFKIMDIDMAEIMEIAYPILHKNDSEVDDGSLDNITIHIQGGGSGTPPLRPEAVMLVSSLVALPLLRFGFRLI